MRWTQESDAERDYLGDQILPESDDGAPCGWALVWLAVGLVGATVALVAVAAL